LNGTGDKVKCLNLGADDYITKPFKINELIARINAILRRNREEILVSTKPPLVYRDIKIDFGQRKVYFKGNEVKLTPIEYDLLVTLASNPESVFTYTDLLQKIWGYEYVNQREYLYVQVRHLREKLEVNANNPRHIIGVPRVGYRFQK
jgi:DNA-binding response OmpR family regulator